MSTFKIRREFVPTAGLTVYDGITISTGSLAVGASGLALNSGNTVKKLLYGATTFTCASVGAVLSGSSGSATFTATGATAGDAVFVTTGSLPVGFLLTGASVTATNVVTLYLRNTACTTIATNSLCNVRYLVLS
jgi:hypothetical protein